MESDSTNAICWVSNLEAEPWKFHFVLNEIKALSSSNVVSFSHVVREANFTADSLAKLGVERIVLCLLPSCNCDL